MNLKDCYTAFGGDYEEVMTRLRLEKTVTKFLLKFSEDKSFFMFIEAFARKDYDEALRFIHTLKGICQNLSFTRLYECSSQITKACREGDYQSVEKHLPQLSKLYDQQIAAIKAYQRQGDFCK